MQIFEIFECLGQNLLNSSCRFERVNSFSNFASFFFVITYNSPVNFKLIHFLLGIKLPHKSPNFESKLSSALVKICQIPHVRSSLSEVFCKRFIKKETLAQVFSCEFCEIFKNTYFYRKPQVTASVMLFSKPQVSFSSNFASLFGVMKDNSSVLF